MKQWFIMENEKEYKEAIKRFEEIHEAKKGTKEYKEMKLFALLINQYGDKGTISKVLNYKQPLSLTMIRLFSKMLRIPADALTKEYKLQP